MTETHRPQNKHHQRSRHNQRPNYGSNERKKQNIRGHDAALYNMVKGEEEVTILLNNPLKLPRGVHKSELITGKIVQYDAYTITVNVSELTSPLILFKSNIGGLTKSVR